MEMELGEKITTSVMAHVKSKSFVDEQVDQFSAFAISWSGDEAIHVTFGRHSVNLKNTRFVNVDGEPGSEPGEVEAIRLDVAAVAMPVEVARDLVATLSRMISHADERRSKGE